MFPGDASFVPYKDPRSTSAVKSPAAGRIFVLKFQSSSQRYLFWLQSPAAGPADTFSARDLKMGAIVNRLWAGDDVDVEAEMRELAGDGPGRDADGDDDMRDPDADVNGEGGGGLSNSTGGAGADATGGDVREEGEEAREGGADGARA
jgi:26S proteasome regulatory subunit N13